MTRPITDPSGAKPTAAARSDQEKFIGRAFVAIALGTAGFLALATGVRGGCSDAIDERGLLLFRTAGNPSDPIGPLWVEEAVRDVTALGGLTVIALALFVLWLVDMLRHRYRAANYHLFAVLLGVGLMFWLKALFERPRPDLVPHHAPILTHSFPSGHAATAALAHLTIGILIARGCATRRFRILTLSLAVLISLAVGTSRIYLGVHWPTDVAAGWIAGAAWAWLVAIGESALVSRGRIEPC